MTRSKRKNLILIAVLVAVLALGVALGVTAGLSSSRAAENEIVADYTVTAGETVAVRDLIGFDEDGVTLSSVSVRFLGDNTEIETTYGEFVPEKPGMYKVTLVKNDADGGCSRFRGRKARSVVPVRVRVRRGLRARSARSVRL